MPDEQRPALEEQSSTAGPEDFEASQSAANASAGLNGSDPAVQPANETSGLAAPEAPEDEASADDQAVLPMSTDEPAADAADAPSVDAEAVPAEASALSESEADAKGVVAAEELAIEVEEVEEVEEVAETASPSMPSPVEEALALTGENARLVATLPESILEAGAWLPPEFAAQERRFVSPLLGRAPGRLPAIVLAALMAGVFAMFVLIEPTPVWLALLGAIVAAVGTDGVLRSIRGEVFAPESGRDTVPHLFLPTLFALAVPLFIEENLQGYLVIPAAVLAAVAFILIVLAEVPAESEEEDEFHGRARFVSIAGTYFVAFALFSLSYALELGLRESLIAIALTSVLLAVELLREGEIDPIETLLLACVVGIVVAEARWILHFMPLDAYPAGLALLLAFYFVTGMVHAYITRHINVTVATEYSIVTVLGVALVIAARATGIA